MSKKWYNMFVSVDAPSAGAETDPESAPPPDAAQNAAQMVAQIAATVPVESKFTAPVRNPTSFEEIYHAAEITPPAHGYTIEKVATMLQSEHLRGLSNEVKRSSILVALEASGAKIEDVIQDAVRRDRALDGYERVLQKSLNDVQIKKTEENRQIEAEMNKMLAEYRARIQANNEAIARETERFSTWRTQKQQEEKTIADTVGYFVSENPITVSGAAAPPPPSPKTPPGPAAGH
jgi:Asp-tRNA(Asn)/Glu-tRNA(Gln) amidotransferase A subunit family amidase